MKKWISIIVIMILMISLVACSTQVANNDESNETEKKVPTVTDVNGRTVELPEKVEKVVVTGVGALRLYAYAGNLEKLVGVEAVEHANAIGRPYTTINQERFKSLPVIGEGGPQKGNDPEKIVTMDPDVIFTTYENPDELQRKTGIPVVSLSYGNNAVFDDKIYESLKLIGLVVGTHDHAKDQVAYLKACETDLKTRTSGIEKEKAPKVYVGAMGSKGAHGIESTRGKFIILDVINANNVVDQTGKDGGLMVDKEQILQWDPDFIFIDMNGLPSVLEDYQNNKVFYKSLSATKNKKVYGQMPFNFLTTNIDTAITDAYFIGKMIYPEAFHDVDVEKKADEIYTQLLGKPFYEQMEKDFGGFKNIEWE